MIKSLSNEMRKALAKTSQITDNSGIRGIGIWLEINNGQHLEVEQMEDNGMIEVRRIDGDTVDNTFTISAGDMLTMLNWFRYQKDNGNISLEF